MFKKKKTKKQANYTTLPEVFLLSKIVCVVWGTTEMLVCFQVIISWYVLMKATIAMTISFHRW